MTILSDQLVESRLNLSMQSEGFLLLNNEEFVEVESVEMQYEEAKIGLNLEQISQHQGL